MCVACSGAGQVLRRPLRSAGLQFWPGQLLCEQMHQRNGMCSLTLPKNPVKGNVVTVMPLLFDSKSDSVTYYSD